MTLLLYVSQMGGFGVVRSVLTSTSTVQNRRNTVGPSDVGASVSKKLLTTTRSFRHNSASKQYGWSTDAGSGKKAGQPSSGDASATDGDLDVGAEQVQVVRAQVASLLQQPRPATSRPAVARRNTSHAIGGRRASGKHTVPARARAITAHNVATRKTRRRPRPATATRRPTVATTSSRRISSPSLGTTRSQRTQARARRTSAAAVAARQRNRPRASVLANAAHSRSIKDVMAHGQHFSPIIARNAAARQASKRGQVIAGGTPMSPRAKLAPLPVPSLPGDIAASGGRRGGHATFASPLLSTAMGSSSTSGVANASTSVVVGTSVHV